MTGLGWFAAIIVGGLAGWIAEKIMKSDMGLIMNIILGIIGIVVALGLFTGAVWARAAAIVIASLSIIANFLWMPYYPLWSILVIALDVVVVWAVATWDRDRV